MGLQKLFLAIRIGLGFCLVAFGLAFDNARAQSADACGPAPAVKAALDQLPRQTPADTLWQFGEQRLAALQALLRQYPEDVFIQQAYIHSVHTDPERDKVMAEYKSRHEQNPASAQLAYLYGLALVGASRPRPSSFSTPLSRWIPRSLCRTWSW